MQIIMMEHMQIPFRFNDELGGAYGIDFYHWAEGGSLESDKGPAYNFQGMINADLDPTCSSTLEAQSKSAYTNVGCAHIISEVWSGQNQALDDLIYGTKQLQSLGPSGITGRVSERFASCSLEGFGRG